MDKKKVVFLDTDLGVDDSSALLLLLAAEDIDLRAIFTVHGNTSLKNVNRNVCQVLEALDHKEIPLFFGASKPIFAPNIEPVSFMGSDGLGGYSDKLPQPSIAPRPEFAPEMLVKLVNVAHNEQEDFTLLMIGPLTNLALSLAIDPHLAAKIPHLVIMGGTSRAIGNTSPVAEFNFFADPEAASAILGAGFPDILILPWETSLDFPLIWEDYDQIANLINAKAKLFININRSSRDFLEHTLGYFGLPLPDPLVAACVIAPEIITKRQNAYCSVELDGGKTRGFMSVDRSGISAKMPNVVIAEAVNYPLFRDMLFKSLT